MKTPKVRTEGSDNRGSRPGQRSIPENPVGMRIFEALKGRSIPWLSQRSGQPENTVRDAMRRGVAKSDLAIALAAALDCSIDWLLTGENSDGGLEAGDFVGVQEIDLAYGLGGTFMDSPVEVQVHQFPRNWLETITTTPASLLTIARGRGDSMQPTIQDGDMVLIDRSQNVIRELDAIWALTVGEMAMIKRVRALGPNITMLSDHERVPPFDVFHEEVNVVGRVIFIGRNL